jgi:hypothetical protein
VSVSGAIEVAVGLVFTYFVFSSICSGINEGIARILNSRGTQLFQTINGLIGDLDQVEAFWKHDLITSLSKARSKAGTQQEAMGVLISKVQPMDDGSIQSNVNISWKDLLHPGKLRTILRIRRALPSYISPATVVTVMKQVAGAAPSVQAAQVAQAAQAAATAQAAQVAANAEVSQAAQVAVQAQEPPAAPSASPAQAAQEAAAAQDVAQTEAVKATAAAQAALANDEPTGFWGVLASFETAGLQDEQRIQAALEKWFNDAMDRLSGWYKRFVQVILLCLAILVTIGFNVSTIHVAQELWRQPTLQAAISAEANQVAPGQSQGQTTAPTQSLKTDFNQASTLPVGWGAANQPEGGTEWFLNVLGWLLTIGALTFGAPFWFDLLTRMNSLRATGPPPTT